MKSRFAAILITLFWLFSLSACAGSYPRPVPVLDYASGYGYGYGPTVDINFFYGSLAPYGSWFDHGVYGRVWRPYHMAPGWRPYTAGHWVFTQDYGWLWVSDWIWGWAPFHYGRWTFDPRFGWIWIPDTVWGPAWVFWRYGGGYAAWAPIPPEVYWRQPYGLALGHFHANRDLPQDWWIALPQRHFSSRHLHRYVLPWRENARIFPVTEDSAYPIYRNDRIVNQGIPLDEIERSIGHRIQPARIRELQRLEQRSPGIRDDEVQVLRPNFRSSGGDDTRRFPDRSQEPPREVPLERIPPSRDRGSPWQEDQGRQPPRVPEYRQPPNRPPLPEEPRDRQPNDPSGPFRFEGPGQPSRQRYDEGQVIERPAPARIEPAPRLPDHRFPPPGIQPQIKPPGGEPRVPFPESRVPAPPRREVQPWTQDPRGQRNPAGPDNRSYPSDAPQPGSTRQPKTYD
ncbi:MAG: DUF6600 domain-containing protein [Gammaproteobacteria bacterium]